MRFFGSPAMPIIRSKKIPISDIYWLILYIYIISAECGHQELVTKTFNGGRISTS